jgi:hypothetical protein
MNSVAVRREVPKTTSQNSREVFRYAIQSMISES